MSDLEIWEGVVIRKSSYRTKFVNGALMSSPVTFGGYLIYKYGKWVYERMAYGDKKEEEIPLSPFPIANPVVYHFHPVAFVEQMRRIVGKYEDVSLTDIVTFYGYRASDPVGCFRRCVDMLNSCGYTAVSSTDKSVVQITKYKSQEDQTLVL